MNSQELTCWHGMIRAEKSITVSSPSTMGARHEFAIYYETAMYAENISEMSLRGEWVRSANNDPDPLQALAIIQTDNVHMNQFESVIVAGSKVLVVVKPLHEPWKFVHGISSWKKLFAEDKSLHCLLCRSTDSVYWAIKMPEWDIKRLPCQMTQASMCSPMCVQQVQRSCTRQFYDLTHALLLPLFSRVLPLLLLMLTDAIDEAS